MVVAPRPPAGNWDTSFAHTEVTIRIAMPRTFVSSSAWSFLFAASSGLFGCGSGTSPSSGTGEFSTYEAKDEAQRARFAEGLRVGAQHVAVTQGAAPGYVPDATCARCHPDIAESYAEVGMARSFWKAGPASVVEDFSVGSYYHEVSDRHYSVTYTDGEYEFTRYQLEQDGTRYNVLTRTVDSIIGSAHKGRSYLYRTPSDELYLLPLAWYAEDRVWKMSPGYERADHSGFLRQVTLDCMFCHNAYPEVPVGSDVLGAPQRFPKDLPQGLGCQRCHGPGAEHVAKANENDSSVEDIAATIFNAGRLAPERRADVCMQCHLQSDSSMMSIVRRPSRADYSYRPDQPLIDYIAHIESDDVEDFFQINHHPYRLFQSRCHAESEGRLTCLTCHDPHAQVPADVRAEHYRNACLTCHQVEQCGMQHKAPNAAEPVDRLDCVTCHMTKRRTQDVIEIVMTDHLIRRTPPEEDLTAWQPRRPPRAAGTRKLHPFSKSAQTDADLLCAISGTNGKDREAIEALGQAVDASRTSDIDVQLHLASGLWNTAQVVAAAKSFQRIAESHPDFAFAHRMLGRALLKAGRPGEGLTAMERARQLDPNDPEAIFGIALACHRLGQDALALEGFRSTLRLRPLHLDAHLNIAHLLSNRKDYAGAAEAYHWVHRIDPTHAEAYFYHGLMLLLTGQQGEARTCWRRGGRAAPDDAPLAGAWAVGHIYAANYEEALEAVEEARALGADPGVCLLVEALALNGLGQTEAAIKSLTAARATPVPTGLEASLRAVLDWEAQQRL